jgi:electron transfer flavoprotein alpha subunit
MLTRTISKSIRPQSYRSFSILLLTTPLTEATPTLGGANFSALNCTQSVSGSEEIHVLTPTSPGLADAQALIHDSVSSSTLITHESFENPTSSSLLTYLNTYLSENPDVTTIVAPSTSFYKDFLPQLAAKFNSQMISDVIGYEAEDSVFVRAVYAGNAVSRVKSVGNERNFLTVRSSNWDAIEEGVGEGNTTVTTEAISVEAVANPVTFVSEEIAESERPDLGEAKIVVSGGRGLKNGENFKLLEDLADALGDTAIGASRAAVDAGYCANDMQVGQTGKIVAPELYIAIGISGAIQHLAGMKDSKVRPFSYR